MPRTVDEGFRDFLSKLTPSSTESQAAKGHRASIAACLRNRFALNRFVRIGSFGNGTSITGFSDVDYLACIPTDQLRASSTLSLARVRNALDTRFPDTGVRVSCPAVLVPFGRIRAESTEIVPADYVGEDGGYPVYDIADCANGWMRTSPDAHNAYVRRVDERLGWKVRPLIRFLKAWKCLRYVPISSFYLELRVAKYASNKQTISYEHDVRAVLKHLYDYRLASIQDPMGVSGYIHACKTEALRKVSFRRLETALARADKALDASWRGNIRAAFIWWRLLYNQAFPTYYR